MTAEEIKIKYPDIDINMDGGVDNYREGVEIIERNNVACIIEHPTENKYLVSKWKKVTWNGFLTGGIDNNTKEEAATQEVREETGYTDIAEITDMNYSSHGLFYHPHKLQNRLAHYNLMYVKLNTLENKGVSEEELAICDFIWVDRSEVMNLLTRNDMKVLWEYFDNNKDMLI